MYELDERWMLLILHSARKLMLLMSGNVEAIERKIL